MKPKSRKENIVTQELEKELLIYDLKINKAFSLNETSRLVFQLSDGSRTVAEISDLMSKKLRTLISKDFVLLALIELEKDNLLEKDSDSLNPFSGLSRREIVRRVGFASMIALPLISSVIAPSAAMALSGASGIALLGACPSGTGCSPGLTCKTCSSGCSGQTCCANTATTAFGNGHNMGCVTSVFECNFVAQFCCSGVAILSPDPVHCINNAPACFCSS